MARNYILAWIALIGIAAVVGGLVVWGVTAWGVVPDAQVIQPTERLSFPSGFPEVLRSDG